MRAIYLNIILFQSHFLIGVFLPDRFFTRMPHEHYLEVTNLLLKVASDDISRAEQIRELVKVVPFEYLNCFELLHTCFIYLRYRICGI